jgi:hypothetical protein
LDDFVGFTGNLVDQKMGYKTKAETSVAEEKVVNNYISRAQDLTVNDVITSIRNNRGFISSVAKDCRVSRKHIYDLLKRYPEIEEALKEAREETKDFAELQLLKNISSGKENSLIFFLQTQASDRGYVKKHQIEIYVQHEINMMLLKLEQHLPEDQYEDVLTILSREDNRPRPIAEIEEQASA